MVIHSFQAIWQVRYTFVLCQFPLAFLALEFLGVVSANKVYKSVTGGQTVPISVLLYCK